MWAKVDDGFWCHPKVIGLPLAASGLWVRALSWSCAQRLDLVPETFVRMVGGTTEDAAALVDAGLWIATDDGYRIHNWTEYQTLTTSERRAEAGRKGGIVSGQKRSKAEAKPKQTASKNSLLTKQTHEAGTHPIPTRKNIFGTVRNRNRRGINRRSSTPASSNHDRNTKPRSMATHRTRTNDHRRKRGSESNPANRAVPDRERITNRRRAKRLHSRFTATQEGNPTKRPSNALERLTNETTPSQTNGDATEWQYHATHTKPQPPP